jgi:hypothetical protein
VRILRVRSLQRERGDVVARESLLGASVVLALLGLVGLGWALAPLPSVWLRLALGLAGLPCLLVFALMLPGVARTWRRGHWIVLTRPEGIGLNVRSVLNADLPDDEPTVAWIDAGELAGVRIVEEPGTVPASDGGSQPRRSTWIELVLSRGDTVELDSLLQRERRRRGRGRTHFHAWPVEVVATDRLRVAWSTGSIRMRPAVQTYLAALGRHHRLLEPVTARESDWRTLPDEALDGYAHELAAAGRRLDALRVLRERRGWELVRAKAHLEALERRARAA